MDNIKIKKVTPNDAKFLFSLMNNKELLNRLNEVPTSLNDWQEAVNAWENDADEENYIICADDNRIGWFAFNNLNSGEMIVYLKMAALLPEYQCKGIGTFVLKKLLDSMKKRGYKSVALFTNKDNERAQKCYKKCGFKVIAEQRRVMTDNTCADRYKMECNLY